MNKERFHNSLALQLGHQVVEDERFHISVSFYELDTPIIDVCLTG